MDKEKTILANNTHKIKVLNLLRHLYMMAAEALEAFYSDRHVHLFDPHVGEASCQIRAIKIALMARDLDLKTCTKKIELAGVFKSYVKKIDKMIDYYHNYSHRVEGRLSALTYLKYYNLDCLIDKNDLFIVTSYLLTHYKCVVDLEKDVIDYRALQSDWSLSLNAAKKFIQYQQRLNSFCSVDYVLNQFSLDLKYYQMLSFLLKKDQSARWVLPSFENSKLLVRYIEKYKLPIMLSHIFG